MPVTPYQMAVNNVARYIRKCPDEEIKAFDAFTASSVLAIAFCKLKEDVMADLLRVNLPAVAADLKAGL